MQTFYARLSQGAPALLVVLILLFTLLQNPVAAEEIALPGDSIEQPAINQSTGKININTADAQTLAKALKGVGLKRAQAIIEYRNAFGPFKTPADLTRVKGIGEHTLSRNISLIAVE